MAADLLNFERLAHLSYVPLPGGEQAVRQPWRMAAAYLYQAYGDAFLELDIPFVRRLDRSKWRTLAQMIVRKINSPPTSSLGRLFDAVAALIGLRSEVVYEGQAAIELETLSARWEPSDRKGRYTCPPDRILHFTHHMKGGNLVTCPPDRVTARDRHYIYPFATAVGAPTTLDVSPMIRAIVSDIQQGVPTDYIAGCFHRSIAQLLATACCEARQQTGLNIVALSGGVFQNQLLHERLMALLEGLAFQVYINRRVPPNDGGLSLGQLAIAAARLQAK